MEENEDDIVTPQDALTRTGSLLMPADMLTKG